MIKGPNGESFASIMFPLPMSYLIFRAPSETAGKKWMEAIELSLQCSTLLGRHLSHRESVPNTPVAVSNISEPQHVFTPPSNIPMNESEIEKHFGDHGIRELFYYFIKTTIIII